MSVIVSVLLLINNVSLTVTELLGEIVEVTEASRVNVTSLTLRVYVYSSELLSENGLVTVLSLAVMVVSELYVLDKVSVGV